MLGTAAGVGGEAAEPPGEEPGAPRSGLDPTETQSGTIVGTPSFMPPEPAAGRETDE